MKKMKAFSVLTLLMLASTASFAGHRGGSQCGWFSWFTGGCNYQSSITETPTRLPAPGMLGLVLVGLGAGVAVARRSK